MARSLLRYVCAGLLLLAFSPAFAADNPPPVQGPGQHSSITVSDGAGGHKSIRDDAFAEMLKNAIMAATNKPTSVKVFFNSCYGGGMLDDIAAMLADPACFPTPIPFVGGSAANANEPAWGPSDAAVGASTTTGSYWTNSLANAITNMPNGQKVVDTLGTANANDPARPGGPAGGTDPEHPQNTSAHGGSNVTWGPAESVVFSGFNNRKRHDNNERVMHNTLLNKFGQVYSDVGGQGTQGQLQGFLNNACADLDGSEELVVYIDDHGDTEFDLDEWWSFFTSQPILIDPFSGWTSNTGTMTPSLHPGWQTGLMGNLLQGDPVNPVLTIAGFGSGSGGPAHLDSFFDIFFDLTPIPLPSLPMDGTIHTIPIDWTLLTPGNHTISILPKNQQMPNPGIQLAQLELGSGQINELESSYIPEPTSLTLLAIGGGMLLRRRRAA